MVSDTGTGLTFVLQIMKAYQNTSPGSVACKLRHLEMIVIACHNITVFLYRIDDGTHIHAEREDWHAEKLRSLSAKGK